MQKLWIKHHFVFLLLLIPAVSQAQFDSFDLNLITHADFYDHAYDKREVKYLFAYSSNPLVKYNPLSLFFGGLMFSYQKIISPQFSASCIFHPSCSNFSIQLIREFGLLKGIALSADRVTRCSRIAATDIHPLKMNEHTHKAEENTDMFKWKH